MVLEDHEPAAGLGGASRDELFVDRLQREHVDHPHRSAVLRELLGGVERLGDDGAVREDRRVRTLAGDDALADADLVLAGLVEHLVRLADGQADVDRALHRHRLAEDLADHDRVADRGDGHVGQRAHEREILDRVVGRAAVADESAVGADDLDRQVRIADVRAHLLERAHAEEGQHARHDGDVAVVGEAGGDPDAHLLGEPDVQEPLRELVAELDERRADVGGEHPQVRVVVAELGEGRPDDGSRGEHLSEGEGDGHQTDSFSRDAWSAAIARSRSAAPSDPACQARLCSMKSTPLPLIVSQMTTVGRSLSVAGSASMASTS